VGRVLSIWLKKMKGEENARRLQFAFIRPDIG
jgi:hypothetical protein